MKKYFPPQILPFLQTFYKTLFIVHSQSADLCPTSHQFQGQLDSAVCAGGGPPAVLDVYRFSVQEPDTTIRLTVLNPSYDSLVRLVVAENIDCVKLSENVNQAVLFDSGDFMVQDRAYSLEIRTTDPTPGPYTITLESDKPICLEDSGDDICVNPPLNNPCNIAPDAF